jgi:hypothetical protein
MRGIDCRYRAMQCIEKAAHEQRSDIDPAMPPPRRWSTHEEATRLVELASPHRSHRKRAKCDRDRDEERREQ